MTATKATALKPGRLRNMRTEDEFSVRTLKIAVCRECRSSEFCTLHSRLLHSHVPLAEQHRQRPAKPQRLVQLQHGTPTFAEPGGAKVALCSLVRRRADVPMQPRATAGRPFSRA